MFCLKCRGGSGCLPAGGLEVAQYVWDAAHLVVRRVAGDIRVRAALARKASPGEGHGPLPVQVGLLGGVPDCHVLYSQPLYRERQLGVARFSLLDGRRRARSFGSFALRSFSNGSFLLGGSSRSSFWLCWGLPRQAGEHGDVQHHRPDTLLGFLLLLAFGLWDGGRLFGGRFSGIFARPGGRLWGVLDPGCP